MVQKSAIIGRQSNPNRLEKQKRQSRCYWQELSPFISHIVITHLVLFLILSIGQSTALVRVMGNPKTPSSLTYDVVIVGGGSAGLTAAKLAAKTLKKSTLIVEVDRLGGDCTWTGTAVVL
jgi:hypothetical protein